MNPKEQAQVFLQRFKELSRSEVSHDADSLLLFFYDLRDHYSIEHSSSPRFVGRTFHVLGNLIYSLESSPEETLFSESLRDQIISILEDIASGRVVTARQEN